jgi:hypothetical protein
MVAITLLRALAVLVFLVVAFIPKESSVMYNFRKQNFQILVATFVVAVILLLDAITGLILGASLLMVYLRLYVGNIDLGFDMDVPKVGNNRYPMTPLFSKYITNEHLHSAQTNVVSEAEIDTQIIGIPVDHVEDVLGTQGLYKKVGGIDQDDKYAPAQFK